MMIQETKQDDFGLIPGLLIYIGFMAIVGSIIFFTLYEPIPIVKMSVYSNECIEVIGGYNDCDNLPKKYEIMWVK